MKPKSLLSATFAFLLTFNPLGDLQNSAASLQHVATDDNNQNSYEKSMLSITVPNGFEVTLIASGLSPIASGGSNYPNSLQDVEFGKGGFGDYLYFIDRGVVYRVATPGVAPQPFASVSQALVMRFGFGGDLFVGTAAGQVIRVLPNGTTSIFAQAGSSIEGMAFDTSSEYGSRLYISEWIDGGSGRVSWISSNGSVSIFSPQGTVGNETTGLEFCNSPVRLYVADQSGTVFEVTSSGSASLLGGIDLNPQMQQGEFMACSRSQTSFGNYLYMVEQGYQPAGRILRVSLNGTVEVFASGFQGFDGWGVTGLKFSPDGRTLYVTDDAGRSIYAIQDKLSCEVPFFWQRDPRWKSHELRSAQKSDGTGTICGTDYDTLGEGGCTLTSAAMLFRHYGASQIRPGVEMNPPNLSDCMGTSACRFGWLAGASCSMGKAANPQRATSFSYEQLAKELNDNHRPVILQMCTGENCLITHWVLVTGGQGSDPANYTIWDPWFECGQNMRLNSRSNTWNFIGTAVYDGTPTCSLSAEVPLCARSVSPVGLPVSGNTVIAEQHRQRDFDLTASSDVSGTALVYRATNITMTVRLTAQSSLGSVTEMLIWSDSISNTVWQPFSQYAWLPVSNFVYARFRDNAGNVSDVASDTPNPSAPDAEPDPKRSYLPIAVKQ